MRGRENLVRHGERGRVRQRMNRFRCSTALPSPGCQRRRNPFLIIRRRDVISGRELADRWSPPRRDRSRGRRRSDPSHFHSDPRALPPRDLYDFLMPGIRCLGCPVARILEGQGMLLSEGESQETSKFLGGFVGVEGLVFVENGLASWCVGRYPVKLCIIYGVGVSPYSGRDGRVCGHNGCAYFFAIERRLAGSS